MRVVVQRVSRAAVRISDRPVGSIGNGLLVLLGIAEDDTEETMKKVVKKMIDLRIFQDENDKTNLSLEDVGGELLVVSQFTLLADCKKGRRPSFIKAGSPGKAKKLYEAFLRECKTRIPVVEHGEFGAKMQVDLVNEGPFTIVLDSEDL